MFAIVVHKYGGLEELKFEQCPDPVPGANEVLVRVAAASINPIDLKRRAGETKDFYPIQFPGIIGVDLAGTVVGLGPGVKEFSPGDRVLGFADRTYAGLCSLPAANLAKIPEGLDVIEAAALPLVVTTGHQLISLGAAVSAGQRVLITGAAGGVGRSAVFTARERGAFVIAGVRKSRLEEAAGLGANQSIAMDDDGALASLSPLDAVADTVDGQTAQKLIAKVRPGGVFASVLGTPGNAAKFPAVKVVEVYAQPDAKLLLHMALAVREGKLKVPIAQKLPLKEAAKGHALAAQGIAGKILLIPDPS